MLVSYICSDYSHASVIMFLYGARCSSVVERPLVVQWVVGLFLHGGPIEIVLVPTSPPRLV